MEQTQRIKVWVTLVDIPAGTDAQDTINSEMIEARRQDTQFVIEGAITEQSGLEGTSLRDIRQNEVVTVDMFGP